MAGRGRGAKGRAGRARAAGRAPGIDDLLFLLAYLEGHPGAPVGEVARKLGVTVERLFAIVEEELPLVGRPPFGPDDLIDIWCEDGRLYLQTAQGLGQVLRLTAPEALALTAALRALGESGAGRWAGAAASALARIRASLAGDVARRVEDQEHRFVIEGDERGVADRFEALRRGFEERRAVRIRYYTAARDAVSERTVRPYLLVQYAGWWYVVGHDSSRGETRTFKLERILSAEPTGERFEVPAGFDASRHASLLVPGDEPRRARVRLRGAAARQVAEDDPDAIEPATEPARAGGRGGARGARGVSRARAAARTAPPSGAPAGDDEVVARLPYATVEGLAARLMPFGDRAEVLDPPELRAALADRCRRTLLGYR